jgi:hypothetical protein
MLTLIRAMSFYLDRCREDRRARKIAMGEFIANGWRNAEVEKMRYQKQLRSYRRAKNGYHR